MTLVFIYLLVFLLPGWVITAAFGSLRPRFLFAVAISFSLAIMVVLIGKILTLSAQLLPVLWLGVILLFSVLSLWQVQRSAKPLLSSLLVEKLTLSVAGAVLVAIVMAIYALWVGPYVEIPSDAIWHVGRIQDKFELIANNQSLEIFAGLNVTHKLNHYWYLCIATLIYYSGFSVAESLYWINVLN